MKAELRREDMREQDMRREAMFRGHGLAEHTNAHWEDNMPRSFDAQRALPFQWAESYPRNWAAMDPFNYYNRLDYGGRRDPRGTDYGGRDGGYRRDPRGSRHSYSPFYEKQHYYRANANGAEHLRESFQMETPQYGDEYRYDDEYSYYSTPAAHSSLSSSDYSRPASHADGAASGSKTAASPAFRADNFAVPHYQDDYRYGDEYGYLATPAASSSSSSSADYRRFASRVDAVTVPTSCTDSSAVAATIADVVTVPEVIVLDEDEDEYLHSESAGLTLSEIAVLTPAELQVIVEETLRKQDYSAELAHRKIVAENRPDGGTAAAKALALVETMKDATAAYLGTGPRSGKSRAKKVDKTAAPVVDDAADAAPPVRGSAKRRADAEAAAAVRQAKYPGFQLNQRI
jgi:hypothetical protein